MRLVRYLLVLASAALSIGVAHAAEPPAPPPPVAIDSVFGVAPVADAELAAAYGTGALRPGDTRQIVQDEWQGVTRLNATIVVVTFDNWFHDVGSDLIAANVRAARGLP